MHVLMSLKIAVMEMLIKDHDNFILAWVYLLQPNDYNFSDAISNILIML